MWKWLMMALVLVAMFAMTAPAMADQPLKQVPTKVLKVATLPAVLVLEVPAAGKVLGAAARVTQAPCKLVQRIAARKPARNMVLLCFRPFRR